MPFVLTSGPFGLLFGIVGTEAGLDLFEVMSMSILVIAGASQFAAVAQMQDAAPVALVVGAALAVNLRTAIYSAALAPHLGAAPLWQRALAAYLLFDNSYAAAIVEYDRRPAMTQAEKMLYYLGTAIPVAVAWVAATLVGALVGQAIPPEWALDFAVPLAFLAILAPMLRTLAHLAAAVTSIVLALALAPLPYNTELLVAAAVAMAVGAETERRRLG